MTTPQISGLIVALARAKAARWHLLARRRLGGLVELVAVALRVGLLLIVEMLARPGRPARKIGLTRLLLARLLLWLARKLDRP